MTIRDLLSAYHSFFSGAGIIGVLFVCVAIFWIMHYQKYAAIDTNIRLLGIYSTIVLLLLLFPPTALALVHYQSAFYSYNYLWGLLPINAVIALSTTLLAFSSVKARKKWTITCAFLLFAFCFCGSLFTANWKQQGTYSSSVFRSGNQEIAAFETMRSEAILVSDDLLWAPQTITTYCHLTTPSIATIYGRDMWEPAMDGFSYDTYSNSIKKLYDFMQFAEIYQSIEKYPNESAASLFEQAFDEGVTKILLPDSIPENEIAKACNASANIYYSHVEKYYLIYNCPALSSTFIPQN